VKLKKGTSAELEPSLPVEALGVSERESCRRWDGATPSNGESGATEEIRCFVADFKEADVTGADFGSSGQDLEVTDEIRVVDERFPGGECEK